MSENAPGQAGPGVGERAPGADRLVLEDHFDVDLPLGALVGSRRRGGSLRGGIDLEGALGVDHGAARIRCLVDPGWGRAALVYGPFSVEAGLSLAVSLVNGLNTSQTSDLPEGRRAKLKRLLRNLPDVRWNDPLLVDNLAVGWFEEALPDHPPSGGDCFVNGPGPGPDGELRVHNVGHDQGSRIAYGVQNLAITYVATLREDSVVLFASSLPGARAYGPYPSMRPVMLSGRDRMPAQVFAGIHQSILGEVHYRLDTRIHAVRAAVLDDARSWHAWAALADRFTGSGPVAGSEPAIGPSWDTPAVGTLERTSTGATAADGGGTVFAVLPDPVGLLHAVVDPGRRLPEGAAVVLHFRRDDRGRNWAASFGSQGVRLEVVDAQRTDVLATTSACRLSVGRRQELQVLDDGASVGVYLDGRLVFDRWFDDPRFADATGVGLGVQAPEAEVRVGRFEALPRLVGIPPTLDPGPPWDERGNEVVLADRFATGLVGDLAGRRPEAGRGAWERSLGDGTFDRWDDDTVAVRADPAHPNPGRTLYTLPWHDPTFVDLAVTITPPGLDRGEGHAGRGGLVVWQDEDNHLVFNNWIDDGMEGRSISVFLRTGGHEEMYDWDAVWSNVDGRIRHGVPHRLRVRTDGDRLVCDLDGEPVMQRAVTDFRASARPLTIRRVGLAANWEWGDDTGTRFSDFVALGRSVAAESAGAQPPS